MKNPYVLRMECIELAFKIEQERYHSEKDRFLKDLIPDYPEYPTDESLFQRIDCLIKKMGGVI